MSEQKYGILVWSNRWNRIKFARFAGFLTFRPSSIFQISELQCYEKRQKHVLIVFCPRINICWKIVFFKEYAHAWSKIRYLRCEIIGVTLLILHNLSVFLTFRLSSNFQVWDLECHKKRQKRVLIVFCPRMNISWKTVILKIRLWVSKKHFIFGVKSYGLPFRFCSIWSV